MTTVKRMETGGRDDTLSGGKLLAGAVYVVTVLCILGFLWQSFVDFWLPG
jgi:hypothetical protein